MKVNLAVSALPTFLLVITLTATSQTYAQNLEDPVLVRFEGGTIGLQQTETFARELPLAQRVPYIKDVADWRRFMARELSKCIIFTTPALTLGHHLDPGYLRSREYFIQEYLDFALLRDSVINKIDVSKEAQQREFELNRNDYVITPTVTLRYIRTKNQDAATSAAARIAAGEDFVTVEREVTEVSPRYIGRVLGPFPSEKARTAIPPPAQVLQAALDTPVGATTGPLQIGANYFLARTEAKTTGGLAELNQVAELVETRIRDREGSRLQQELMQTLRKELNVQYDEALLARKTGTRADDIVATIGATLVTRQEFDDLNGRVRGPAITVSQQEPTRLRQFITPIILAEGARSRGYLDRAELNQAVYYFDIQHLSTWYIDRAAHERMQEPSERDLRMHFAAKYKELKENSRGTTPTFELFRESMADAMRQERFRIAQDEVVTEEFQKRNWRLFLKPQTTWMTAFEAVVHAQARLPKGALLQEVAEASEHKAEGANWHTLAGRNPKWRITYSTADGGASEIISEGPATVSDGSEEFTSAPVYQPYRTLWRFDTDSMFRHAIDKGMADFASKHEFKLRLASSLQFAYSEDVPTSPTDCLVTFTATPLDESVRDGFVLKYSAITGDITQRRIGEPEGPCPTCPAPDLPASAILNAAQGQTTGSRETTSSATPQAAN